MVPKKKVIWYGVYKKIYILGSIMRSLEEIKNTKEEAEEAKNRILKDCDWLKPNDIMIEEVEVTMKAWNPGHL